MDQAGPCWTTGPASGSTSHRASATCRSGRSGRPPSPSCTATCWPAEDATASRGRRDRDPPARGAQKGIPDAVIVDELIGSNPVERAKRPRAEARARDRVGSPNSGVLARARQQGCSLVPRRGIHGARRGGLINVRWATVDTKKMTITGSTAVIGGERVNGTTKSGRTRVVSIDDGTVALLHQREADQAAEQLQAGDSGAGPRTGTCSRPAGASRSTPIPSHR